MSARDGFGNTPAQHGGDGFISTKYQEGSPSAWK
jgi:hypothetical protein